MRDSSGEVVGVISLMIDGTERRRAMSALEASEARKEAVLRAAIDCFVIVDHEGLIVDVNPATEETFGWTRGDAIGKPFLELAIAPDNRDELASVLAGPDSPLLGARLEVSALRSDHRTFAAEAAITRVDLPGMLFAVSLRDVTKRREHDERMHAAEAKYRALVEQLPLATYINEMGFPIRTQYMSPQIESMLGYPVDQWYEPDFFPSIVHPDDLERVQSEVERTHRAGEDFHAEYRLIGNDGRVVWILDESVAVRDEEYRPLLLQGFLVDITSRRATAEAAGARGSTHARET